MRFFVVSDVHSFYSQMMTALEENGFEKNNSEHNLIICGDAFDRGHESVKMQNFLVEMLEQDRLVYVCGNHEELLLQLVKELDDIVDHIEFTHHASNGTLKTFEHLTGMTLSQIKRDPEKARKYFFNTPFVKKLLPEIVDFAEIGDFIFVHGWIPCTNNPKLAPYHINGRNYAYIENWREADEEAWRQARWVNGQKMALIHGIVEPGKTIVCGHWHCSWGHALSRNKNPESEYECFWGENVDFSPFKSKGIIAIDSCTAYTNKVNCITIDV